MRIAVWTAICAVMSLAWPAPSWSAQSGWPTSLTIGTASPGGVYLPYGQAVAQILTEALGIPITAQATQGTRQNSLLLESGTVQLAFGDAGLFLEGWNGTGEWTHGKTLRAMRALFPMYDNPYNFVAPKSSEIRSLPDMAGKRVAPGPPSSLGATYVKKMFDVLGIHATWRYGAYEAIGNEMQSGLVDVLALPVASPAPVLTELDRTGNIRFVPLRADEIAKLRTAMPEFSLSLVPASTYPSLTTDYTTIGTLQLAVASTDLPDDLAYAIVKAFYANHERLVKAVPAARESVAENAKRITVIPFHPGAARYYREIGVELPKGPVSTN